MSAGFFGLNGFPVVRQASTAVMTPEEYAAQTAGQVGDLQSSLQAQVAKLSAPITPQAMAAGFMQPVADNAYDAIVRGQNYDAPTYPGASVGWQDPSQIMSGLQTQYQAGDPNAVGGTDNFNALQAYTNGGYGAASGAYTSQVNALTNPISQQIDQIQQQAKRDAADRAANQTIQQNAYNSQLAGGATGGLLSNWNGLSGGSATSTVQPGSVNPTSASAWGSTGLMGNNGYMGGGGNAPTTTPQTWSSTGQATQPPASNLGMGWGGPFSNKNPWSLG